MFAVPLVNAQNIIRHTELNEWFCFFFLIGFAAVQFDFDFVTQQPHFPLCFALWTAMLTITTNLRSFIIIIETKSINKRRFIKKKITYIIFRVVQSHIETFVMQSIDWFLVCIFTSTQFSCCLLSSICIRPGIYSFRHCNWIQSVIARMKKKLNGFYDTQGDAI